MKKSLSIILLILVQLALLSCSEDKGEYFKTILKSEKNYLRDIQIGNSLEEVKSKENNEFLLDDMHDYLHYDYELDMGNSYTVSYDFSEDNSLYEIEISVYLDKIDDAKILCKDFTSFFGEKSGENSSKEDGYNTWTTSLSGEQIKFSLKEESKNYGFVSIKVRDLNFLN